jgi:hypothetical protein
MAYPMIRQKAPKARLPKIRSKVTVSDFRKLQPKVIREVLPVVPDKRVELPKKAKPVCRRKKSDSVPCAVPIKQPMSIPRPGVKQAKKLVEQQPVKVAPVVPVKPSVPKEVPEPQVVERPKRSLLRAQLEGVRKGKRGAAVRRSPSLARGKAPINPKAIEKLRGIGKGRVLVIVAAGPSVLEVDFGPLREFPVVDFMCINKPFPAVWPSRFWAFCDHTQQRANQDAWNRFEGVIINSPNVKARKSNQVLIRSRPGKGFSTDVTKGYHIGRSSTYANMQVAYYMDYDMVYIFGCDMGPDPKTGALHHYGQNPDVPNEKRKGRFPKEAEHYFFAAKQLPKDVRDRFVFCSSWNKWEFTKHFPKLDHLEAVQAIVDYIKGK